MSANPFVAIQVGAVSFVDEGVEPVLETFQRLAGVNALLLATPTWTRGTGGRQLRGHPLPDHGVQAYDDDWKGGSSSAMHPEFFKSTTIAPPPRALEHPGFDLFGDVLPLAAKRGIAGYAWMEESSYADALHDIPGFGGCVEHDVTGQPGRIPCFRNPAYAAWWAAIAEDYCRSWPIAGIVGCSERSGPLARVLHGPIDERQVVCFCPHCLAAGRARGIDPERARAGFKALLAWNRQAASGDRAGQADGFFVGLWRIFLAYPEVFAWHKLWSDGQHEMLRGMGAVARATGKRCGWHIMHQVSWSPFYRADEDYRVYAEFSDFLKVVMYNNCAGPRYRGFHEGLSKALWADAAPDETLALMYGILGIAERPLADLPTTGFSADYVMRETQRAVKRVLETPCAIYSGIDIGIPTGPGLTQTSRAGVRDAVRAALDGGAAGVILSRKYSEMRLDDLAGAGDALKRTR